MFKPGPKLAVLVVLALALLTVIGLSWDKVANPLKKLSQGRNSAPELSYDLNYLSAGTTLANPFQLLHQQSTAQAKLKTNFQLQGYLLLRALPSDNHNLRFVARIQADSLKLEANDQLITNHDFLTALNAGRFVLTYAQGQQSLITVQSEKKLPDLLNALVYDLFNRIQLVQSNQRTPVPDTWELKESDLNGPYRVSYRRDGDRIEKVKLAYEADSGRTIEVLSSKGSILGFQKPWYFENWNLEEKTRILVKDLEYGTSHIQLQLKRRLTFDSNANLSEPNQLETDISSDSMKSAKIDERRARNVLQGKNLDDVLSEFSSLAQNPDADKAHMQRRLVAWALLHPNELDRLVAVAASLKPDDYLFQSVITSLAEAGSPESHAALMKLLESKNNEPKSAHVVYVGMGMSRNPTQPLADFLLQKYHQTENESRETAGLTLGAVLRKMDSSSPEVAAIQQRLVEDFANANDPAEIIATMRIIGNLGPNAALDKLIAYGSQGSLLQRTTALRSMRFIQDPRVEEHYQKILRQESNQKVLNAVLLGLSVRNMTLETSEALRDMILATRDPGLQISGLDLLWKNRDTHSWITEFRLTMAEGHQFHSRVRSFAKKLVP
ncbi:MAG: hypothetical protein M3Q07_26375 [Pseudobdellovibrionaceae bacterium]|nr:hypothetical protein [Pseudobdellovibrionaceae bacterium]